MDIIPVEKRNEKAKAKQLRRAGIVPCCVYGGSLSESISIQMDQQAANKLFRVKRNGSKVQLKLEEQIIPVQIKDKTRNFANNEIEHIGFQALKADQKVNSVAHIILENADTVAGILEKMQLEVPYASLPKDMIDTVCVDLEGMRPGTTLTVGDIPEFRQETIGLQIAADSMVVRIRDKKRSMTTQAAE
ncbi:MAG: 50S ribosomal protein L25 [Lawsonibacter sp.]|nr:50S ribosomal protein L25 [Lawsonibacter sp.]